MTAYYRPIAQTDPHRPDTTLPLAGNPSVWFDRVEVRERGRGPWIAPVADVPPDVVARLTLQRQPVAGIDLSRPTLMGVLNVTPDSFSDGGRFEGAEAATAQAQQMVADGAEIIDIGGESTRPGAAFVPAEEEIARTVPVIKALRAAGITTPISIDTRKANVGRAALDHGADILNDVSGLSFDDGMAPLAAQAKAPICIMHAQGDPKTMQHDPQYDDVLLDVYDYLAERVSFAEEAGISRSRILVDPGIGFGKTQEHNLTLLRNISLFHGLGCTILLGVSRKRFIGTIGNQAQADKRDPGSVAVALSALAQGVQIIRAHDIESHRQAFALWRALHQ